MPKFSADSSTPTYVLMNEGRPIGPRLTPDSNEKCDVIYGFSNKAAYDRFQSNSDLALTPYPLVKTYLCKRMESTDKDHKLVAIDVQGPLDPNVAAATMATVLDAQDKRLHHVTSDYLLTFDEEASAYQLAEVSATPDLSSHHESKPTALPSITENTYVDEKSDT